MKTVDKYIIGTMLIASLSIILYRTFAFKSYEHKILKIYVNNNFYQEVKFDKNTDKTFMITSDLGWNKIEIKSGRVKILDSDCYEKSCINMGFIDNVGDSIVCLPHRLVVKIAEDGNFAIDAINQGGFNEH
ncbi:MAG: NusG domain II-containing protein [Clostridiaceae bacterium]